MGVNATSGLGTRGRSALAGLKAKLKDSKAGLDSAKTAARVHEYLVRHEATINTEMSERERILREGADQIEAMRQKGAGWKAIDRKYEQIQRELNSISAIAERRRKQLKKQFESGRPMNPE